MSMGKFNFMNRGFTLIELIVSVAIMAIVTTLGVMTFLDFGAGRKLKNDSAVLVAKISELKIKAFAGHQIDGTLPKAFGLIAQKSSPNEYLVYADNDGNCQYGAGDVLIEKMALSKGIYFSYLSDIGRGLCFQTGKTVKNICLPSGSCGMSGNYNIYLSAPNNSSLYSLDIELSSGTVRVRKIF